MSYLPPEHATVGEQLQVEFLGEQYPGHGRRRRLDADLRPGEHADPLVKILVCVKRVPMTGGRIVLTDDERSIATRHLGFTISPHEECGVEEAVRIVAEHGGEVVVLTLGPAEAEEQLRDCMAIGADRGILLQTDGEEWDAQATAAAIVDAVRADGDDFDLILFGNESADAGNYQVGIRVAYALGRPVVNGLKGIAVQGAEVRCEREAPGGRDVYVVAAAGGADGARGPEPAALPVGAGPAAREVEAAAGDDAHAARVEAREAAPAAAAGQRQVGRGARRRPGGRAARRRGAAGPGDRVSVLVLRRGRATSCRCRRWRWRAGSGRRCTPSRWGEPAGVAVDVLHVAEVAGSFAPGAWAASVVDVVERRRRRSTSSRRAPSAGNEVLAHVAGAARPAVRGELHRGAGRRRRRVCAGAGSVLEEARLHAPTKLLTVSPHSVAPRPPGCARRAVEEHAPASSRRPTCVVRVTETVAAAARRDLAGRCEGRRQRRPRRRLRRELRDHRGARRAARRRRRLLARRDERRLAAALRPGRPDRDEGRARPLRRLRHQRRDAAHRGLPGREEDARDQRRSRGADPRRTPTTP